MTYFTTVVPILGAYYRSNRLLYGYTKLVTQSQVISYPSILTYDIIWIFITGWRSLQILEYKESIDNLKIRLLKLRIDSMSSAVSSIVLLMTQDYSKMYRVLKHCFNLQIKDSGGSVSLDRRGGFGPEYGSEPYTSVYATAVYNDESHTFEQVIQALQRSLDVGSREAVDLATCIDREGRSIVRCSSFHVRTISNIRVKVWNSNWNDVPPLRFLFIVCYFNDGSDQNFIQNLLINFPIRICRQQFI